MLVDLSFLNSGEHFPPFREHPRLNRYRTNALLFQGAHQQVFNRWQIDEDIQNLTVVSNWHRRLSSLWADMLFGQPPQVKADDPTAFREFVRRNDFFQVMHEAAIDVSRFGEAVLKMRWEGNNPVVETVPPSIWFPVVSPENVKRIQYHVIAWKWSTDPAQEHNDRLSVEIHEPGRIEYRTYELGTDELVNRTLELDEEFTGINEFLVRPITNMTESSSIYGIDDYSDINPIMEELEIRLSQISRVLDKHADPKMYGDETALEFDERSGRWVVKGGGKFFPVSEDTQPPGYLTWDANLNAAFSQLEELMKQFYVMTNTSPASFGQLEQGLAESGSALRRLIMSTIIKQNRLRTRFDSALHDIFNIANQMQLRNNVPRIGDVEIVWRDALPEDITEQTNTTVARYGSGLISLEAALRKLDDLEGSELEAEVERIRGMEVNNDAAE